MHTENNGIRDQGRYGAFVPVLLLAIGSNAWFAFQATQLMAERQLLRQSRQAQDAQVEQSRKLRESLDALARDTLRLAERGNPGAKLIVDELRNRGVTINPEQAAP
jgi:hypothetical protein